MSGSEIASNILDDLIDSIAFNDDSFPNHGVFINQGNKNKN